MSPVTRWRLGILLLAPVVAGDGSAAQEPASPYLLVLGIAQDGGVPQAGSRSHPAWNDPARRRLVVSLAVVDPRPEEGPRRFLFEATPDLREQLRRLDEAAPAPTARPVPALDGVFLTHAHVGHYAGLLFFGLEVMGAQSVPVFAMPRMLRYLSSNGPWDQLVRYENIDLRPLADGTPVVLGERLTVTPFLVPHRQEYSEVVGFRIDGPRRSILFVPDINSWEEWDTRGVRIEERLAAVDVAYLDGCFYAQGEVPGRDMSRFPHPLVEATVRRLAPLPAMERDKVRFIHLNHTNPLLDPQGEARRRLTAAGFRVAEELERLEL